MRLLLVNRKAIPTRIVIDLRRRSIDRVGLRFRRSYRLVPGLRLNLSRSGTSLSFGRRGAWFTVGPRGTRTTLGIPGTGLSWTEQSSRKVDTRSDEQRGEDEVNLFLGIAFVAVIVGLIALFGHLAAH
jgi:uncharacterized protein DUF4236